MKLTSPQELWYLNSETARNNITTQQNKIDLQTRAAQNVADILYKQALTKQAQQNAINQQRQNAFAQATNYDYWKQLSELNAIKESLKAPGTSTQELYFQGMKQKTLDAWTKRFPEHAKEFSTVDINAYPNDKDGNGQLRTVLGDIVNPKNKNKTVQILKGSELPDGLIPQAMKGESANDYYKVTKEDGIYTDISSIAKNTEDDKIATDLAEMDPNAEGITGATGMDFNTFYAATGQVSKLARDQKTRTEAGRNATKYANKVGMDISTLPARYEAFTKVTKDFTERYARTVQLEGEMVGTIDNLQPVADAVKMGTLKALNVAKAAVGRETLNPKFSEYAFFIEQLGEELMGYNAAISMRTGSNVNESDRDRVERIIYTGLNKGSLEGLRSAVNSSTEKMSDVLETNIYNANKNIWKLFKVGDQYDKTHRQYMPLGSRINPYKVKLLPNGQPDKQDFEKATKEGWWIEDADGVIFQRTR